jgi:signal transduction histidine kinase
MQFRTKTILGVALIEMVLLAVLVGSALSILRDSNEAELTRRVQLGGKLLTAAAKDAVISQDLATLDSLADEAMASGQIDFVRILDSGGAVLTRRGNTAFLSRVFHPETDIGQVTDGVFDWSAPVMAGGIRHGEVQLGVSTDPLKILLASAWRWAAGIAVLEMLLVALFSWLLGSYLVRQLVALRKASQRFAAGDLAHRMPVQGGDELAETGMAFNRMAQALGESQAGLVTENLRRIEAQQNAELAQARAEERSEQLNAIFALSPDGFVSFDEHRRVKYASRAFLHLSGLPAGEIAGLDETAFSERLARECAPQARFPGVAALRAAASGTADGDASPPRHLIELAGANKRVLECGIRVSDSDTVSQILYFRDITHEAEVDRMKSEFIATAAHELRTPMTSIYGFAELLLTREFDAADRRDFLATIVRQSELTVSILNELLDLTRIEARRGKDFSLEHIELRALLRDIVAGFKRPGGRHAPGGPPENGLLWVRADRGKLTQAVSNVLSNAYKYSPGGGAIEIGLSLSPAGDRSPARACIRISDQGIGMTPEQLARACERFYRADASGKIPGTGLGMSIVEEIVKLHGGELELASKIGEGTTVSLWLPAAAPPQGAVSPSPAFQDGAPGPAPAAD